MNKIIIAGAGGFLGSHLINLFSNEDEVLALTSDPEKSCFKSELENISVLSYNAFFETQMDLSGYTLVNLAYVRSSAEAVLKENLEFTFHLIKKTAAEGIEKIINISSQSVYSDRRKSPAKETDLPEAVSLYAVGKYYLENWIRDFSEVNGLHYMNLRSASLVGPHFEQRITTRLIKNAIKTGKITIDRNGKILSFTHVEDIVRAIKAALEIQDLSVWDRVYNLGTPEFYSLEQIARVIQAELASMNMEILVGLNIVLPNGESSALNSSRFMEAFAWKPEYDLERIIREEVADQLALTSGLVH